jgi:FkbM family methyltransferase
MSFVLQHFGRSRIVLFMAKIICGLIGKNTVKFVANDGNVYFLDPRQYIDYWIIREKYWELEVSEVISKIASEMGESFRIFWDVGAGNGYHTVNLTSKFPQIGAVAFEPSPFMVRNCQMNFSANKSKAILLPVGLSDRTGVNQFYHKENSNFGMSTIEVRDRNEYTVLQIITYSGDEIVSLLGLPAPQIIKLDVEGHTYETLIGMKEICSSENPPVFILEILEIEFQDVSMILGKYGYDTLQKIDNRDNYLAIKAMNQKV